NEKVTDRGYPNVNRVCGRDDVQGPVGAEFAAGTLKVKTAYVLHDKTTYGQGVAEAFKNDLEKKGVKIVGFEGTEERSNFDPYVATAIAIKALEEVTKGGKAPTREALGSAIRKVKYNGMTGSIEFDDKGDPKKASYYVMQVTTDNPEKWSENKEAKRLAIAAPAMKK